MVRSLCTLPIPAALLSKLRELGFIYCQDVCPFINGKSLTLHPVAERVLMRWTDKPEEYWLELVSPPSAENAFSLLKEEWRQRSIETFSRSLDEYMDGGIPLGKITEISGAPGSGKTQLCLQLCVDVQIPHAFLGLGGQAVYFDTSNGFSLSRLSEIAEACVSHCSALARSGSNKNMMESIKNFSKNTIVQNVFYFQCLKYIDLTAGVIYLEKFLKLNCKVRLIVIDSITFPLQTITDSLQRVKLLCELMQNLRHIAYDFNVAVVITNNLTTKMECGKKSYLAPALGESFGHSVNNRFMFGRLSRCNFVCISGKNVIKSATSIPFQITRSGIRDME